MGSYRQHIACAGLLGTAYAGAAYVWAGVHWLYGSVAALLALLSGLLPDLDSDSGVELKGFTGILGVLAAVAVWQEVERARPAPPFEVHLWAAVAAYLVVRHGLRRVLARLTVHRGIHHSLPTCAAWGALTYLYYPSPWHQLRVLMAVAVMAGFLSHLLLDEVCGVDLRGARVRRSFGTALKFWSHSPLATLAVYGLLSYLAYRVIEVWPDEPFRLRAAVPAPGWPRGQPKDWIGQTFGRPPGR